MSGERGESKSEIGRLEAVLTTFVVGQTEISKQMNRRMNELSSNMSDLVKITARAEEWNISHNGLITRLEENQRDQGKDLASYKKNNDDRVVGIEKQILLLDRDTKDNKKPMDKLKDHWGKVIVALTVILLSSFGSWLFLSLGG